MSSTITALYERREEAERALSNLKENLSVIHAAIYDPTARGLETLRGLNLATEDLANCEKKLASGEYMLLAQSRNDLDTSQIIEILEETPDSDSSAARWKSAPLAAPSTENHVNEVAVERLPVVEEELRVGTRQVIRGGARVRTRVEETPVTQEVELLEEFTRLARRPASRLVTADELVQAGLMRERVVEITQIREEAVVNKEVFVREEVVVSKTTERRVQQIHDTVKRTEVETEELSADTVGER